MFVVQVVFHLVVSVNKTPKKKLMFENEMKRNDPKQTRKFLSYRIPLPDIRTGNKSPQRVRQHSIDATVPL